MTKAKSIALILSAAAVIPASADPNGWRGRILDRKGRVLAEGYSNFRLYPFVSVAGHLIGFVYREESAPYSGLEGRAGVEKTAEETLGAGRDLQLTIDLEKQFVVESVLRENGVGRGAVVVLDPSNGDVLAMASVPSYDPNVWVGGIREEDFRGLEDDPTKPLFNRALRAYPPGSVFKVVAALAGGQLHHRHVCEATREIDGSTFRCWYRRGHGDLGLREAFIRSCNCYFYDVGIEAGVQRLHDVAVQLGLGMGTGIESTFEAETLIPNNAYFTGQGLVPKPAHAANLAIGQTPTTVTPTQLATVAAVVANGGIRHPPRLFLGRKPIAPINVGPQLDGALFGLVRESMRKVVIDSWGTATTADTDRIAIAGKTGTAQWKIEDEWQHVGHFIGFAPYKSPRYAFCVSIEGAKSAGGVCAPLARQILERFARIDSGESVRLAPLEPAKGHLERIRSIE